MSADKQDLSSMSMIDLFRQEVDAQARLLSDGLLALEQNPNDPARLESLMRAAHSIKGAARIVGLTVVVQVAHAMEDCFVAAQRGQIRIEPAQADILLRATDLLKQMGHCADPATLAAAATAMAAELSAVTAGAPAAKTEPSAATPAMAPKLPAGAPVSDQAASAAQPTAPVTNKVPDQSTAADRNVRVSAETLNRLLGMVSETHVQSRWFEPYAGALLVLKQRLMELCSLMTQVESGRRNSPETIVAQWLAEARQKTEACRRLLIERYEEFDAFARRSSDLTDRLYRETLASRMRPFADGIHGFPRMVRDLARQLQKTVRFEIVGQSTAVDRDILDKLEAPLAHLLRNSLDHGLETPDERRQAGKNPECHLTLKALHHAGWLQIIVADDGRGIDLERLRQRIISRGMSAPDTAAKLTEPELLEFLFLPGFSTAAQVTEISGRGVGLDIVRNLAQELGGTVQVENRPGQGSRFLLQLPITLSVVRALLVEIAGEPYALPLTRVEHLLQIRPAETQSLEGRPYVLFQERSIGLVDAREILGLPQHGRPADQWGIVVLADGASAYGLIVDRFLGESKLVVRPLDTRLGKIQDVSAVSLLDDGAPVLILDTEDLLRSISKHLARGSLKTKPAATPAGGTGRRKRILVADDSLTVREIERKLLDQHGFTVEVAMDGMEAWHAVRAVHFDLVVTDVDMPRMNGIDLVRHIRQDARLNATPIIIVSYKDREEDRRQGMEAGANYYLTKSSFHDASFIRAVTDLIGDSPLCASPS